MVKCYYKEVVKMNGFIFYKSDNFAIFYDATRDVFASRYFHQKKDYYEWMIVIFSVFFVLLGLNFHEFYYPLSSALMDIGLVVITFAGAVVLTRLGQSFTNKEETVASEYRQITKQDALIYYPEAKSQFNLQARTIILHILALLFLVGMFLIFKNITFMAGCIGLYYNFDCLMKANRPIDKYLFFKKYSEQNAS